MAVLMEGQKFGLSSKSHLSNKSVLYVKLTDSALRSLEEYLKNKAVLDARQGPSLQFSDNGGHISLPSLGERGSATYSFSLSAEDGGSSKQGRTECLLSNHSTLSSLGSMSEILRVKAGDDVYKRIGQKFTDVKLENEKKSTVFLDNKDKRKASLPTSKVVRKPVASLSSSSMSKSSSSQSSSSSHFSGPGRGQGGSQGAHPPVPRSMSPMSRPVSGTSPLPPQQQPSSNLSQPRFQPTNSAPRVAKPPPGNPEIMRRPLRDRLIHLLAVRPYKKPELLLRINKDGVKEKDKKTVSMLVREVADTRNNVYELKRSMWNDVMEDWPFYTEQDRAALRRRKPQNLTPPGSDTGSTSSGHSPSSTNPPSPPQITNPLKRTSTGYYDHPASKKAKPGSGALGSGSSYHSADRKLGRGQGWERSPGQLGQASVSPGLELNYDRAVDDSAPDWGRWKHGSQADRDREPQPPAPAQSPYESPVQTPGSQMQLTPNKNMDFLTTYTAITSSEQRQRYKSEFNKSYSRYLKLHNKLDEVSKRFTHLEAKLRQVPRGSEDFKNVKTRIKEEYERNKNDQHWQEARSSFSYLHDKLAHIKKLVHDYDVRGSR